MTTLHDEALAMLASRLESHDQHAGAAALRANNPNGWEIPSFLVIDTMVSFAELVLEHAATIADTDDHSGEIGTAILALRDRSTRAPLAALKPAV